MQTLHDRRKRGHVLFRKRLTGKRREKKFKNGAQSNPAVASLQPGGRRVKPGKP
jgi:hypothetical protein